MTVQEVAKSVMLITGTSQRVIAAKTGLSGQGAVSMFLKSKSMRVDNLLKILNTCGYELVARSVDGKRPEFVIGDEADSKVSGSEEERMRDMVQRMVAEELAKSGK